MVETTKNPIRIDLNEFKLHIHLKTIQLTLHFNSPSRRFYLSVIGLVANEMKRLRKITSISLERHLSQLVLLNETIGGSAGSSETESLLPRIYRKWKDVLPDLEDAPLFKVLGKRKGYDEGSGRTYPFTETEKDSWANLFEYQGSEENVRLKFAIDRVGATLDDIVIVYEDSLDGDAWDKFVSNLKGKHENLSEAEAIQSPPGVPESPESPMERRKTPWQGRRRWAVLAAGIVVIAVAVALAWKLHLKPAPEDEASAEKMAFPLPDVPSIAVMPFVNMSGDPKQEFLTDGITEEIITSLSKIPRLFVMSRQSTSFYKGKPVKVKQVSEELGVQYVLEGSVQRSADRIRINTQLIDALTGRHIWSERYERDLKDLFALQDEITMKVLAAVRVKLTGEELSLTVSKYYSGEHGLDCWLKHLEALRYAERTTIEDNNVARRLAEEAVSMCPENPVGYSILSYVWLNDYVIGNPKSPREAAEKAIELSQKALAMDDSLPGPHEMLSAIYSHIGEYDKGIAEGERAVAVYPSRWSAYNLYAQALTFACQSEQAIPMFQKAIRLNPNPTANTLVIYGHALRMAGRFEEAVPVYKKAIQRAPDFIRAHIGLGATYSLMGREKEARAEATEVLRINPKFSLDLFKKASPYKDPLEIDKVINAMRKAGLK